MSLMKKVVVCGFAALLGSASLMAQRGEGERPEPNHDAAIEHLGLDEGRELGG